MDAGQSDFLHQARTIPCCAECNAEHLAHIENTVRNAVIAGPEAVRALQPPIVQLWMEKIFYGLLCYDERFLESSSRCGRLLPRDLFEGFQAHHLFLRSTRNRQMAPLGNPSSLFVYETQVPERIGLQFDFFDNQPLRCMAARMASVGIVCVFRDNGMVRASFQSQAEEAFRNCPLHPSQFREVVAMIAYKTSLIKGRSRPDDLLHSLPVAPAEASFEAWTAEGFSRWLSIVHGQRVSDLFDPRHGLVSYLTGSDGKFRTLDPNKTYRFGLMSVDAD